MKPTVKLAETTTPDGALLSLFEHDGEYCIRVGREELMHSSHSLSELMLGELATAELTTHANPAVLIGGLGLGYTLRAVLEKLSPDAKVHVAELMPAVVEWNRKFLSSLNGALLDDPRVEVIVADVWEVMARAGRSHYDAVMLDIDNGPDGLVQKQNTRLYQHEGLRRIATVLKMGGRATIWSAWLDHAFVERLTDAGFHVRTVPAKLYPHAKRCAYTLFVADK